MPRAAGPVSSPQISVKAHDITGAQIGSQNTQVISESFNTFAAAHGKEDDLLGQMKSLSESITTLVAELQAQDPEAAKEVTETFESFAEESAKEARLVRSERSAVPLWTRLRRSAKSQYQWPPL
jgi:hypothetical protein